MKKSNVLVAALVTVVCILAGIIIYWAPDHPYMNYYNKILNNEDFINDSTYLDIKAVEVNDEDNSTYKIDIIIDNATQDLMNVKVVVVPNDFDKLKTYSAIGLNKEKPFYLIPKENTLPTSTTINYIKGFSIGSEFETKPEYLIIYLEFNLEYPGEIIEEYIRINL